MQSWAPLKLEARRSLPAIAPRTTDNGQPRRLGSWPDYVNAARARGDLALHKADTEWVLSLPPKSQPTKPENAGGATGKWEQIAGGAGILRHGPDASEQVLG